MRLSTKCGMQFLCADRDRFDAGRLTGSGDLQPGGGEVAGRQD